MDSDTEITTADEGDASTTDVSAASITTENSNENVTRENDVKLTTAIP